MSGTARGGSAHPPRKCRSYDVGHFCCRLYGRRGHPSALRSPTRYLESDFLAVSIQEAEKQEKFNETFYTRFDNSVRLLSGSPSRPTREDSRPRQTADTQARRRVRRQRYDSPSNYSRPSNSETRNAQTEAAVRCFECQGLGRFERECPTRLKRKENSPDPRGRGRARGRCRRSQPPIKTLVQKNGR